MGDFPKLPQREQERFISGHQGVNTRILPWLLPDDQVADIENMMVDRFGRVDRRGGTTAFGGRPELPGGFGSYVDTAGDEFFLANWGNKLYSSQGDAGWAQVATDASLVPDQLHQFVPVRVGASIAVAVNTCEKTTTPSLLHIYDVGADAVTHASGVAPRCIGAFQNRIFAGDGDQLLWSEIAQPGAFSDPTNSILVEPGIGGQITSIFPTRETAPRLLIFKDELIAVFEPRWGSSGAFIPTAGDALDTVNSTLRVLNPRTGCVATKSVAEVAGFEDGDILFLSKDGVRAIRRSATDAQAGAGRPLSWSVPDYVNRINFSAAHRAVASVFDNAYHLAVPMDGNISNSHILRFELETRGWTIHQIGARDLYSARMGSSNRIFLQYPDRTDDTSVTEAVTDATLPHQIFQLFSSSNLDPAAERINWKYISKGIVLGDITREKRWQGLKLHVSAAATAFVQIGVRNDRMPLETTQTDTILGTTAGAVVLGQTPLPWQSSGDKMQQYAYDLTKVDPGYVLQVELSSITAASDTGRLCLYVLEVDGYPQQLKFESDG
jgi:hypothetical protein